MHRSRIAAPLESTASNDNPDAERLCTALGLRVGEDGNDYLMAARRVAREDRRHV
ncbi:MAG TPA: hypothetical protein VHX59_16230 [Mycobacteriales bacterium]|nr:hypothetical protein [Mycobacteriales bacterium]